MGLFERKESVVDNDISVEEDLSDLDELVNDHITLSLKLERS